MLPGNRTEQAIPVIYGFELEDTEITRIVSFHCSLTNRPFRMPLCLQARGGMKTAAAESPTAGTAGSQRFSCQFLFDFQRVPCLLSYFIVFSFSVEAVVKRLLV